MRDVFKKMKCKPLFLLFMICLFLISCSESPEELYKRMDLQAEQYWIQNNYHQALAIWESLVKLQPESPQIYQKIGKASLATAQYHKALQAFSQLLNMQPSALETWLTVGQIELILGDIYAAEQSLKKSGKFKTTEEGILLNGDILSALRKYPEAEEEYRKVVAMNVRNQNGLARLALILAGQNKSTEAEKVFTTLTAQEPTSPTILMQMGNYWLLSGNIDKANSCFKATLSQEPNNLHLQIRLAMFHANHKQYAEALTILKPLWKKFPENRYCKKLLIETLLLNSQLAEAGEMLETLAGTEKYDLDFRMLKGKYYMNTLETNAAVSQFLAVVEKEPKLPLGHYLLSLAYLAGGHQMLGKKRLIKCLTLNPDFTDAELALADIYYKNKNYDLALEHAERITKREPENFRPHLIKGNILLALKKYEAALREYQSANLLNPKNTGPAYFSVMATFYQKDTEEALRLSKALLKTNPELIDALLQYTTHLVAEGRTSEAIQFIDSLISDQTSSAISHYLYSILAMLHLEMDRKNEATANFDKALAITPTLKSAYLHLFDIHADDHQKMEKLLISAISNIPFFSEAYARLAKLYCDTKQPSRAIALLGEALATDPESSQLANNLAWLYTEYQPEDLDEAMRLAQKAYEKLPDNAAIADTLGWIYYKKNMATRANWLLEQAQKLDPDNPHIDAHLSTISKSLPFFPEK